jgi:hypothetical protein
MAEDIIEEYLIESHRTIDSYTKIPSSGPTVSSSVFQMCVIRHILMTIEREVFPTLKSVCNPSTCPKMIASDEWHFLCAPHSDKPRDCCAIDYMYHTVDSCASTLLLMEGKQQSIAVKQYNSIVRRLFRIYGHIFFHHSDFFEKNCKIECGKFFLFLKQFGLWKSDMGIIPETVLSKISNDHRRIAPSVFTGTIVDLRSVAMQLEESDEDGASSSSVSSSDRTVLFS